MKDNVPTKIDTDKDLMKKARAVLKQIDESDEETTKRRPGAIINKRKVPYTMRDMKELYPTVTFVPDENIPVTVNGVSIRFFEGQEITCPSVFKDVYEEHRRNNRAVNRRMEFLGVGALDKSKDLA